MNNLAANLLLPLESKRALFFLLRVLKNGSRKGMISTCTALGSTAEVYKRDPTGKANEEKRRKRGRGEKPDKMKAGRLQHLASLLFDSPKRFQNRMGQSGFIWDIYWLVSFQLTAVKWRRLAILARCENLSGYVHLSKN